MMRTISNIGGLSAGNMLMSGGTVAITQQVLTVLRSQCGCAGDTDERLYRWSDSCDLMIELDHTTGKPVAKMTSGALISASGSAMVVVERKKGPVRPVYRVKELVEYQEGKCAEINSAFTGKEVSNLLELNRLTGQTFVTR